MSTWFRRRDDKIALQHVQTNKFLHHNMQSIYQRPIEGQKEICGVPYNDENSKWVAQEGVYVKRKDLSHNARRENDEL